MTAIRSRPFPHTQQVRLGGLRLHERFAVGSTSSICFGWLVHRAKLVAVKRMHPFQVVVGPARRVAHANVIERLGVFRRPGELLATMEYVPGASLVEIAQLTPAVARAIMADALRGLHAVHQARLGALPSGLSPASIIVAEDGRARLIDADVHGPVTAPSLVHKLPYASPEQVLHRDHPADVRRDVYAASVVLWEALTGRRLFRMPTVEGMVGAILRGDIPSPSAFTPAIDERLDAVVLRGLARDPSTRFPSALAMAIELERSPHASPAEITRALDRMDLPGIMRRRAMAAAVTARESNPLHIECTEGVPKA